MVQRTLHNFTSAYLLTFPSVEFLFLSIPNRCSGKTKLLFLQLTRCTAISLSSQPFPCCSLLLDSISCLPLCFTYELVPQGLSWSLLSLEKLFWTLFSHPSLFSYNPLCISSLLPLCESEMICLVSIKEVQKIGHL